MAFPSKKDITAGMKKLLDVPLGTQVRLAPITKNLEKRLKPLGLYPGDCIRVLRIAPFDGPLLIEAHGREIALGRQIAKLIMVEEGPCESL